MVLIWTVAALLTAQAEESPANRATPIENPGSWVTDLDYPAQAIEEGITGTVVFKLHIDETGRAVNCEVNQAAHPILDEATCRVLLERARFRPAEGPDGRPVPGTYSSRVVWQIPEDAEGGHIPAPPFCPSASSAELSFSLPTGRNADCRFEAIGPVPLFLSHSPCSILAADSRRLLGPGAPAAGTISVRAAVVPEGQAPPHWANQRGELLAGREWAFRYGEDRRLTYCELVRKDGSPDPDLFQPMPDLCGLLGMHVSVPAEEGSEPPSGRIVLTVHLATPED